MDNFTPLKVEKKKRKVNKFLIFGNLFLVVLVAAIGIFYYNKTLITKQQKAIGPPNQCTDTTGCQGPKEEYKQGCCSNGHFCDAGKCINCSNGDKCTSQRTEYVCNGQYCLVGTPILSCEPPKEGETCGGGGGQTCPNGQPPVCDPNSIACVGVSQCAFPNKPVVPFESCGASGDNQFKCYTSCTCNPTSPTPTPPDVTNTPTPTPTNVITNTPTPTRTPTPTPTSTPTLTPTGTLTPTPTGTLTPTPTNTPGPSATPIPVLCGTKDCDNATNPCRTGYNCVQANDGSNYCTSPDFTDACKSNPSYGSCCTAPGAPTATPTEIVLAQTTVTSPPVPVTGMVQSFMYLIPALIMFIGLIL